MISGQLRMHKISVNKSWIGNRKLASSTNLYTHKNFSAGVTDPNKFFIVCKKSRIESNTSFYGCFYLGPFDESLSQTLANDLRRTLLSELVGLAITSVEIEGVLHKFSSLNGLKEPVLDLICNLQTVVLKKNINATDTNLNDIYKSLKYTKKTYTGFLKVRGPRVIRAGDLKLPFGIQSVDPNQYICTLAEDGVLNMKFNINEGRGYVFQKPQNFDPTVLKKRNVLLYKTKKSKNLLKSNDFQSWEAPQKNGPQFNKKMPLKSKAFSADGLATAEPLTLDAVFMPVTKVNCIIEDNNFSTELSIFKNNLFPSGALEANQKSTETSKVEDFLSGKSQDKTLLNRYGVTKNQKQFNSLIVNQDKRVQKQASLFFKNSFVLYKNNLKLNKLYQNIKQQTKNRLIPWHEDLLYFNFVNLSPAVQSKAELKARSLNKAHKKDLAFSLLRVKQAHQKQHFVKTFLSSYNFNLSKSLALYSSLPLGAEQSKVLSYASNNADNKNLLVQAHNQLFKQQFKLPCLAKKLLYPEKYPNFVQKFKSYRRSPLSVQLALAANAQKMLYASKGANNSSGLNAMKSQSQVLNLFEFKKGSYQDYLNLQYSNVLKLKPVLKKCHLVVEIWTNGSIHPRQALYDSFSFLSNTFLKLQKVQMTGSMFKSELAYANINKYYINQNLKLIKGLKFDLNQSLRKKAAQTPLTGDNRSLNKKAKLLIQKRVCERVSLPLGVLPVSLRCYTALRKGEIYTLQDLLRHSKKELLKFKNFGPKSLYEVQKTLADLGLSLPLDSAT